MSERIKAAKNKKGAYIIELQGLLDQELSVPLEKEMKEWLLTDGNSFIFDLKSASKLSPQVGRLFAWFQKQLDPIGKDIYSININKELKEQILSTGLRNVFRPVQSLDEIGDLLDMVKKGGPVNIDVNIINPFIESTLKTFEVQLGIPTKIGKASLRQPTFEKQYEVAAIIEISAKKFSGCLLVGFKKAAFVKIYNHMVGESLTEFNEEVGSGVSEIINIIYGGAKTILNSQDFGLQMVLPKVLVGDEIASVYANRAAAMFLPFTTEGFGDFCVEVLAGKRDAA
jgi:CheY-specific phosphatase CheX/anti-anti-sigma regulatory factor